MKCRIIFLDGSNREYFGFTDYCIEGSSIQLIEHRTFVDQPRMKPIYTQRKICVVINVAAIKYVEFSGEEDEQAAS